MSTYGTDYTVTRDKALGTATVTIRDHAITYQRADRLARGMFVVPVKLRGKMFSTQSTPTTETRVYDAIGWL